VRNLVAELERRFRDEALTSAAQAATIILGCKKLPLDSNTGRTLVSRRGHFPV
jgi:hypothetical protein